MCYIGKLLDFEWKMGFGVDDRLNKCIMSKNPFLLPPDFYKNLFAASAILQKPNQTQNECNKLFNAQNFPRNLLFSCGDDKEVKLFHVRGNEIFSLLVYPPYATSNLVFTFKLSQFFYIASFIEINVGNFLHIQQKISSGFTWPAEHSTENNAINKFSSDSATSEKEKTKKSDSERKSSPRTPPANQPESNFSLSPTSATNLDTMPVPGAVQGQNPTQGQYHECFGIMC